MNLSDYLVLIREQLDDGVGGSTADDWEDAELVRIVNTQMASMAKELGERNEGYHNFEFNLLQADGIQVSGQDWDYRVARAIWRITRMWTMPNGVAATAARGISVPYVDPSDEDPGFYFTHSHKLRLSQRASAEDLQVQAVKIPAAITRGTLPLQTNLSNPTTELRLDVDDSVDALLFPHEREANGYANAVVEITGADVPASHIVSGQVRLVKASAHKVLEGSLLYTVLTLDEPWDVNPAIGDTYELHLELHDTHNRYMVLRCARNAWLKKGAKDELQAMAQEYAKEEAEWQRSIFPRQIANPKVVRTSMSTRTLRARGFDSDEGVLSN